MRHFFMVVLSLSISGALTGILILLLHPLTQKYFSKRWNYYIWLLVLARLLIPFSFKTDFLHFPSAGTYQAPAAQIFSAGASETTASDNSIIKSEALLASNTPQTSKLADHTFKPTVSELFSVAAYICFFGVLAAFFMKQLNYIRFLICIKKDIVPITDPSVVSLANSVCARLKIWKTPVIYESSSNFGPITLGFWKPIIIVPSDNHNLTQLQFILHHELIHISRKDLWLKWAYHLLLCIHWFNPVLYFIGKQINYDCELSCDEAILANLTETGKRVYGNVLLDSADRTIDMKGTVFSTTFTDKKSALKKRLYSIVHYQKRTSLQLLLSICTFTLILLLTACSGIAFISEDLSASIKNDVTNSIKDSIQTESSDLDNLGELDTNDSGIVSQILTSLSSPEEFLTYSADPDPSGSAWNVYDDNALLAGKDIQEQWSAYNYYGGNHTVKVTRFLLYGSDSIVIAYCPKETNIQIKSSFETIEGNFKIVQILPDGTVLTINDTGTQSQQSITLKKGRNVIKLVGQGAKLKNLNLDYTGLKPSICDKIYYSEAEEIAAQLKESLLSGNTSELPMQKNLVMENIYLFQEKEASEILNVFLTQNVSLSKDELVDLFIFSDNKLSSTYLEEAVKNKMLEPLSADTITELMPYLYGNCKVELLSTLPAETFYDTFSETINYLNNSEIQQCLEYYLNAGGMLSYSEFDEISPFLNKSHIKFLEEKVKTIKK